MNIFPIFENRIYAFKLWKKTINYWPDDEIKLRFVESNSQYWFILYCIWHNLGEKIGFAKNIALSRNYQKFKERFEKKAILRFGIYRQKKSNKRLEDNEIGYELYLFKKSKIIYDLVFLNYSDLSPSTIEFRCIDETVRNNAQKI
jgi:hypothetical protein